MRRISFLCGLIQLSLTPWFDELARLLRKRMSAFAAPADIMGQMHADDMDLVRDFAANPSQCWWWSKRRNVSAVSQFAGDEVTSRLGQHSLRRALQPNQETLPTCYLALAGKMASASPARPKKRLSDFHLGGQI